MMKAGGPLLLAVWALGSTSQCSTSPETTGREHRPGGKDNMALEDKVRTRLDAADIVFVGQPVRLRPSPGAWSGRYASYQQVEYRPIRILKGQPPTDKGMVVVSHLLVARSMTADHVEPRLNLALFSIEQSLLVLARVDKGELYALDENDSVMLATEDLLAEVQRHLASAPR